MLRYLWDFLFVRRKWTIIDSGPYQFTDGWGGSKTGRMYTLQDQNGNIKKKVVP